MIYISGMTSVVPISYNLPPKTLGPAKKLTNEMNLFWILSLTLLVASFNEAESAPPMSFPPKREYRNSLIHGTPERGSSTSTKAGEEWRLPTNLKPITYNIRLLPFLQEGNFTTDGYIDIFFECVQPTNNITFSSAEITIDESSVTVVVNDTNQAVSITEILTDAAYEKITLRSGTSLTQGTVYKMSMKFTSILNDQLRGFYRSSYVENGVTKWLAVSDFEPADARRAFPCFDDPSMKAIFHITLGRQDFMTSVSNMPLKETIPMDGVPGYVWDIYEPSVKMSTYLVAMMVSEYVYVESDSALSNVRFRIWGRPQLAYQLEWAKSVAPVASEFLENYFAIDYPISKQDLAAIPDFTAGAMENWGFITFGESFLYYDPNKSLVTTKELVTEVISHELVHQWTGNLVTMDWWSSIWLNEGMARYFQYRTTNAVNPDFGIFEQFPVKALHSVMLIDSEPSSRPIYYSVNSPEESDEMFESISYNKGASVIRMMANFMGDDTFTRAMNLYLTRKAYSNANQDDLFQAMNDQVVAEGFQLPTTIKAIMDTWTLQNGFPLVTVTRNYLTGSATLTQERFLRVPSSNASDHRWWIPLNYVTNTVTSPFVWMSDAEESITITLDAPNGQWVVFNLDQKGFYRVKYDSTNYALIRDQLLSNHTLIPNLNRGQLLDDAFNLALANLISYNEALDLTLYLGQERRYSPWHAVLPELNYLDSMLLNTGSYGEWRRYMSGIVAPYFDYLGFNESPNDAHLTILSRTNALKWACKLGVPQCVQNATDAYAIWTNSPANVEVISRNQKDAVLCTAIERGSEGDWEYAYDRFLNPLDPDENSVILNAMGCTRVVWLLARMLDMMLDPSSGITGQNAISSFNAVANNQIGNSLAFDFLRNRFDDLNQIYSRSMPSLFRSVSAKFNTALQLNELLAFRDAHLDTFGDSSIVAEAISNVQSNIQWMETNAQSVITWLSQH